ncbi:MAG: hypothetical protein KGI27_10070 [Thaumarchaeota archaeon]|nr:hypothetical protein [Nitrososphaerota archaeon]
MAKQVVHVGVALATDGPLPGRDNILAIGATIGGSQDFTINVKPPVYKSSPLWDKHPEEFKVLQKDAISLANAMDGFDQWLKKSQGRLIACTSNLDFWHLFISMMEHLGGCPFGSIPIDTNSFYCGYNGLKTPGKITDKVLPLDIAKERWLLVTEGRMPQFGPVKMKHRKSALDADYPPPLPRIIESFQPTPLNQPRATSQATIAYGHFTLGNPDR